MSNLRRLLSGIVLALLTLGYLASQFAYLYGDPMDYAARVNTPPVKLLSLVIFLAAIASCFFPEKSESP